jgi:outer membrane protein OmpA-like peptidoglycan-associated protein
MHRTTVGRVGGVVVVAVAVTVAGFALRPHGSGRFPVAPIPTATAIERDPNVTLYTAPSGVLFDVASATIDARAIPTLQRIADDITRSHLSGTVRVEGYTDDAGPEDYNYDLSERRGQSVAGWLADHAGIDPKRIKVYPHGETHFAQANDTEAQRQANRRVVIAVDK